MRFDRRTILLGAGAAMLPGLASEALGQVPDRYVNLMRKLMARTWQGKSRIASDGFVGNEFVSDLTLNFQLASDWTYTGTQVESFNMEGNFYRGVSRIRGDCWVIDDKAGLAIREMRVESGTPLPSPLFWSSSRGELRFFNDGDRDGHFILKGTLTDINDGSLSRVELYDAD